MLVIFFEVFINEIPCHVVILKVPDTLAMDILYNKS